MPATVFGTALVDGQLTAVEWVGVATAAQVALGAAATSAPQCEMPA